MEKTEYVKSGNDSRMDSHAWFQEELASLGGKWRYLQPGGDISQPQDWTGPEFDDRTWNRIVLPQGDGESDSAAVIPESGKSILLRRSFRMSRDQGSRRIIFRLRCPVGLAELWINETFIGSGWCCGAVLEFDVTRAIQPEKNQVSLRLTPQDSSGEMLPDEVCLYTLPGRFISDVQARLIGSDGSEDSIDVTIRAEHAEGFFARVALMDGNQVLSHGEVTIRNGCGSLQIPRKEVRLWDTEDPALYRIAVILWDGIANYHTRELTTGFRQIRHEEDGLFINGRKERILSSVYHFRDAKNAILPFGQVKTDLSIIRNHNFNAIALTEPAPEFVYALCDRIGLYVLDSSGLAGKEISEDLILEQYQRLLAVRGNHPSVIGWDLAGSREILSMPDSMVQVCQTPAELDVLMQSHAFFAGRIGACQDTSLREMMAALAPVVCRLEGENLTVENRSLSRSTSEFDGYVILTRDGQVVWEKPLEVDVPPCSSMAIPMETRYDVYKPGRYHLTAEYRRRDGSVISRDQWEVGNLRHIYDEKPGGTIREESGRLLLRSQSASYTIDRSTGCPEQLGVDDLTMFNGAMLPVFSQPSLGLHLPDEWKRFTARWKKNKPAVLEVDQMTRTVTASFRLGSGLMQTYRLFADGSLSVELRLRTGKTAPERIGWQVALDHRITGFRWFGLGPDASVPEHRLGRSHGIHSLSTADGGYRNETDWLELTDDAGRGFRIRCEAGMAFKLEMGKNGNLLTLEQGLWALRDPHTTYTFSFTLVPII